MQSHFKWSLKRIAAPVLLSVVSAILAAGASTASEPWPAGTTPAEVGWKSAQYVLNGGTLTAGYADAATYYGILVFAEATEDEALRDRVIAAYAPFLSGEKQPTTGHMDNNLFGILPFEIYRQTGISEYLPLAQYLADEEWENPLPNGLTRYTRWWGDDLYMVCNLQIQAYKNLGDPIYAEHALDQHLAYLEVLQQPNGLLLVGTQTPFHWGRGNGWAASGITETLLALPEDYPRRDQLMEAYLKQMQGLLACQDADGMWHQLIDEPDAWPETSGTGMFIFAMATGVHEGWLPADPYKEAARRAWLALARDYVDAQGRVSSIARGIWADENTTREDYLNAEIYAPGNLHGQLALMWAATAIQRLEEDIPPGEAPVPGEPGTAIFQEGVSDASGANTSYAGCDTALLFSWVGVNYQTPTSPYPNWVGDRVTGTDNRLMRVVFRWDIGSLADERVVYCEITGARAKIAISDIEMRGVATSLPDPIVFNLHRIAPEYAGWLDTEIGGFNVDFLETPAATGSISTGGANDTTKRVVTFEFIDFDFFRDWFENPYRNAGFIMIGNLEGNGVDQGGQAKTWADDAPTNLGLYPGATQADAPILELDYIPYLLPTNSSSVTTNSLLYR